MDGWMLVHQMGDLPCKCKEKEKKRGRELPVSFLIERQGNLDRS